MVVVLMRGWVDGGVVRERGVASSDGASGPLYGLGSDEDQSRTITNFQLSRDAVHLTRQRCASNSQHVVTDDAGGGNDKH